MEISNGRARERFYHEQQEDDLWRPAPPALSSASMPWGVVDKEHMFDKVVTPSDVGKLNRLVIPKQHAEKYFPMGDETDRSGLLLSFEDSNGEAWRFRYSYWSSSQSYVMTKGWSRFVKDKRLDAGDTVSFARARGDGGRDRLFIDWKRRPVPRIPTAGVPLERFSGPYWGGYQLVFPPPPTAMVYYHHSIGGQLLLFRSPANSPHQADLKPSIGSGDTIDHPQANAGKSVRLFGVNLVCSEPKGDSDAGRGSEGTSLTASPLLQIHHRSVEYSSSLASSSSTSREQHSSLDLDLGATRLMRVMQRIKITSRPSHSSMSQSVSQVPYNSKNWQIPTNPLGSPSLSTAHKDEDSKPRCGSRTYFICSRDSNLQLHPHE